MAKAEAKSAPKKPNILAGEPDIVEKLKKGYKAGTKTFKVHIDGFNLLPFLKGEVKENPRKVFFYWSDDGDMMALRCAQWKVVFAEQRARGLDVWREPLSQLRGPKIFNLRSDPFEEGQDSTLFYDKWMADRAFLLVPAQQMVGAFLKTFEQFPPRQRPASFSIEYFGAPTSCGTNGCRAFSALFIPGHDRMGANLGAIIAPAGDLNGDGGDDLVVSTPENGSVFIYRTGDARELPLNFAFPTLTGVQGSFGSGLDGLFGTALPSLAGGGPATP